ncbi:MAG: Cof-type HAD-IIB family hydrolase [Gemmiger sp.]
MQDIRIIGLDLDGTVFDDRKQISRRTLDAIAGAIERGVWVLPATGRPLSGVPEEFLQMPGVDYALTSNGATVTEMATGKLLVRQTFPPELAMQTFDLLNGFDCILDVFIDGESYSLSTNLERMELFAPPELLPYIRRSRHPVEDMHAMIAGHPDGVEKFSILYRDPEIRRQAWDLTVRTLPVEATASFPNNMELNAPGVDKGTGLLALAGHLGLGPQNVMACGDSGNDLAMLQKVGLGVAMGNAAPEIKAAARYVTLDNNHDGVAAAIEKFVLNG